MDVTELQAEHDIKRVIYRYCRGVDRRDFACVRSCYHHDAYDDHGVYKGGVGGFIDYLETETAKFAHTMHFTGNVLIELAGQHARTESYTLAFHRIDARAGKPDRDLIVGLRYVDRFEQRWGKWAISQRVCVFGWSRMSEADDPAFDFASVYTVGRTWPDDPVYAP